MEHSVVRSSRGEWHKKWYRLTERGEEGGGGGGGQKEAKGESTVVDHCEIFGPTGGGAYIVGYGGIGVGQPV
jgi:hypothetical protein